MRKAALSFLILIPMALFGQGFKYGTVIAFTATRDSISIAADSRLNDIDDNVKDYVCKIKLGSSIFWARAGLYKEKEDPVDSIINTITSGDLFHEKMVDKKAEIAAYLRKIKPMLIENYKSSPSKANVIDILVASHDTKRIVFEVVGFKLIPIADTFEITDSIFFKEPEKDVDYLQFNTLGEANIFGPVGAEILENRKLGRVTSMDYQVPLGINLETDEGIVEYVVSKELGTKNPKIGGPISSGTFSKEGFRWKMKGMCYR